LESLDACQESYPRVGQHTMATQFQQEYVVLESAQYHADSTPQTAVSMSAWVLHQDENYFPNALEFNPDRWANMANVRRMEKAFVPFGKGSRICVGMP
jgi:cytochrome P450